jgi:2,3-bisphosphoglycerate-dependent phosphoglycerate mutase
MERDVGKIAGLTSAQFKEKFPHAFLKNPFDPMGDDGEGDWALFLRAGQALNKLLNRPPGQYLVVSHGGILNQALHGVVGITPHAKFSGLRFQFRNSSFSRLIYFPDQHRWTIDSLNDTCHSPESRAEDPRH